MEAVVIIPVTTAGKTACCAHPESLPTVSLHYSVHLLHLVAGTCMAVQESAIRVLEETTTV